MKQTLRKNFFLFALFFLMGSFGFAQLTVTSDVPLTLHDEYSGYYNYVVTGKSLRTFPNDNDDRNSNECQVSTSGSAALSGIPAGAPIVKAYLYWSGSGPLDNAVTFQGQAITADRTYTASGTVVINRNTYTVNYFNGVKDVTSIVAAGGNATYTLSDLSVSNAYQYCNTQTVLSGWALMVMYEDTSLAYAKKLNLYEGFDLNSYSTTSFTLTGLKIPYLNPTGKITGLFWEGDETLQGDATNPEQLRFNNNVLTDTYNPATGAFNSTINSLGVTNSYGLDLDTYDVSGYLTSGGAQANLEVQTGQDLVMMNVIVLAVDTYVPKFEVTKISDVQGQELVPGQEFTYTIVVKNTSLVEEAINVSTSDIVPTGTTYVDGTATKTYPVYTTQTGSFTKTTMTPSTPLSYDTQTTQTVSFGTSDGIPSGATLTGVSFTLNGMANAPSYRSEVSMSLQTPSGSTVEVDRGGDPDNNEFGNNSSGTWNTVTRTNVPVSGNATGTYTFNWYDSYNDNGLDQTIQNISLTAFWQSSVVSYVTDAANMPPNLVVASNGVILKPNDSLTVRFNVRVDDPLDPYLNQISNTATANADNLPTLTTATLVNPLSPYSDLELTKTISSTSPQLFDNVTFTITIVNKGPRANYNIVVKDYLPADLQYLNSTPSIGTTTNSSGTITWNLGSNVLQVNQSATLTITAKVLKCGNFTNNAEIFSATRPDVDSTPGNGQ